MSDERVVRLRRWRTGHLPLRLVVEGAAIRKLGAIVENLGGRERREGERYGG